MGGRARLVHLVYSDRALPPEFHGLVAYQLTDLHLRWPSRLYRQLIEFVSGVRADLWLLTGDLLETGRALELVARLVRHLDAEHGVFGVLGNNDHRAIAPARTPAEVLEELGVRVLCNCATAITRGSARLWLAGVDDPSWWQDDVAAALADVPEGEVSVLLAHSPDCVWEAAEHRAGLILCGHTHGGQLCLPVIGALQAGTKRRNVGRRFASGVLRVGESLVYVCRGLGTSWVPIRLFCPREVARIEFRRAAES